MKEKFKALAKKIWGQMCLIGREMKLIAAEIWQKATTWVLENPDKVGKFLGICFCMWLYSSKEAEIRKDYNNRFEQERRSECEKCRMVISNSFARRDPYWFG